MVILSDLNNMFWALTLEAGKRYEQTTERGFHISMACLEPSSSLTSEIITVALEQSKKSFILCCLQPNSIFQQPLDLNFAEGEEICFYINGKGTVYLTGYMHLGDESLGETFDNEEFSSNEESTDQEVDDKAKKRKLLCKEKKNKRQKISNSDTSLSWIDDEAEEASKEITDDDDDDDDEDEDDDANNKDDVDSEDDRDDDLSEDEDDSSRQFEDNKLLDKASKSDSLKNSRNAKIKSHTKTITPKLNSSTNWPTKLPENLKTVNATDLAKKNKTKTIRNGESQNNASLNSSTRSWINLNDSKENKDGSKKNNRKTLEGGIIVEDIKEGNGAEAKPGKHVQVFYSGKLSNGKIFDQKIAGNPFKFKLGKKEVIAGWDVGIKGMKVGGKRKLVIPPKYGYGNQEAGSIPHNSTLTFDIELLAVK